MRFGMRPAMLEGAEAFAELDPDLDQVRYTRFLDESRLIARVVLGEPDRNLELVERLVASGLSEDEAFDMVLAAEERQTNRKK